MKALEDFVIVKPVYKQTRGDSKIIIPDVGSRHKYFGDFYGIIQSIGPKFKDPKKLLKVGDKIYFTRHEGKKFFWKGEEYLNLKSRWILGKYEGE